MFFFGGGVDGTCSYNLGVAEVYQSEVRFGCLVGHLRLWRASRPKLCSLVARFFR